MSTTQNHENGIKANDNNNEYRTEASKRAEVKGDRTKQTSFPTAVLDATATIKQGPQQNTTTSAGDRANDSQHENTTQTHDIVIMEESNNTVVTNTLTRQGSRKKHTDEKAKNQQFKLSQDLRRKNQATNNKREIARKKQLWARINPPLQETA